MHWTPIDPKLKLLSQVRLTWTESAADCYESNKDCNNCQNYKATEEKINWPARTCLMPITVQKLLDLNVKQVPRSFYINGRTRN